MHHSLVFIVFLFATGYSLNDTVLPERQDVTAVLGEVTPIQFVTNQQPYETLLLFNSSDYFDILNTTVIHKNGTGTLWIRGKKLTSNYVLEPFTCRPYNASDPNECLLDLSKAYVRLTIIQSRQLDWIVDLVGWAYFFAWSISFYPQIFLNCRRKSVIGLNFDFLLLNVIGFSAYTLYNLLIFYNHHVQDEYEELHPRSPIPVLLNDVVFAVHALIACLVTGAQCFLFERENQRVSRPCILLASLLVLGGAVSGVLSAFDVFNALHFVNSLSYIKMIVTMSKYFPQAYYNFRRRSTVGWSIGNVLLDFTGGTLDILQMVLQAINVDDWSSFYGNPVKFGLGLVSILFDVVFIVQHYVLYRDVVVPHNEYAGIENPDVTSGASASQYGSNDRLSQDRIIQTEE